MDIGAVLWLLLTVYVIYLHVRIARLTQMLKSARADADRWRKKTQTWHAHWWELHDMIARGGEELVTFQRTIRQLMHKTESSTSTR